MVFFFKYITLYCVILQLNLIFYVIMQIKEVIALNDKEKFAKRLAELIMQNNISKEDLSLSIGHTSQYIEKIINKNIFPSLKDFFKICKYLKVAPEEFFNYYSQDSELDKKIKEKLYQLNEKELKCITEIVKMINQKNDKH